MNFEKIRDEFLMAFYEMNELKCVLPPDPPKKHAYKYFYLNYLQELSQEIKNAALRDTIYDPSDEDFSRNFGARFTIDMGKTIKFSREGRQGNFIPAHSDMATRVLSAGNIHFSEDYSQIVAISNKSGHFRPQFATLVFAIPLILHSSFPLAERIELRNEETKESIMLSKTELMDLLPRDILAELDSLMELNQSTEAYFEDKSYQYEQPKEKKITSVPRGLFEHTPSDKGRLSKRPRIDFCF